MSLINGKQRDVCRTECGIESGASETFWSDIDKFVLATSNRLDPRSLFSLWNRTIDEGCGQAAGLKCVDLILHQRNQWRHNKCRAFHHHRGQLITERFATA